MTSFYMVKINDGNILNYILFRINKVYVKYNYTFVNVSFLFLFYFYFSFFFFFVVVPHRVRARHVQTRTSVTFGRHAQ